MTPQERADLCRRIARKGGAKTKARLSHDPNYYKEIAAMGGRARARKYKADDA